MATDHESRSEIQQFYDGKNIFVTGATGFIGQVVVEKILRSCSINTIYILIRPKKSKEPVDRLRRMFSTPLFEKLRTDQPDFIDRVVLIAGDAAEPNLGLSAADEELIAANTHVVIHCAATITLNGPLKHACFINVRATRDLMIIAQRMRQLKSFVYVSTAFSNPNQPLIEEKIYKCHVDGDLLINMVENMPESIINSMASKCIGSWPNTYTFTKCIAENIVEKYGQNMPICIARPCVVLFTMDEPVPGWMSNIKSIPGFCMGLGIGAIRVTCINYHSNVGISPADKVANMILTSAWHASNKRSKFLTPVFNHVPNGWAKLKPIGQLCDMVLHTIHEQKLYSEKEIWKPSLWMINSNVLYTVVFFLWHYVPACFIDVCLWLMGKKMIAKKLYNSLDVMMREMKTFSCMDFNFDNKNVKELVHSQSSEDKILFDFDLSKVNYSKKLGKIIRGARRFILNDTDDLTNGRKRHRNVMVVYYTFNTILCGFLLYLVYELLKMILKTI